MQFVIRRKQRAHPIEYWTGIAWCTYKVFAKDYSFGKGLDLIEKRFHTQNPTPQLVRRAEEVQPERVNAPKTHARWRNRYG